MSGTQQPQRGGGRPGAMTMAMAAVKTASGPKVLRIGVIQGGKIIDERIIRNRDTVTIGTTEKNTFALAGDKFPSQFELFQMAGGTYRLNFTEQMDGRVAMPQGVQSLAQIRQSGQATKGSVGWQVPLNEQCRGKVTIEDVTFLFQFVAPPPPQPKPQLPAAIRAGWVKDIDWAYNFCLAFFLVCAFGGIAYVEYLYDPEIEDSFALDSRLVTLVQPPAVVEPDPTPQDNNPQETSQNQAPSTQPTTAPQRSQNNNSNAPAQTQAQRQARAEAASNRAAAAAERAAQAALSALMNNAEFQVIAGATDTGRGSAVDRLASGGLTNQSLQALQQVGGINNAAGSAGVRRTGLAASAAGLPGGGRSLGAGRTVEGGAGNNISSGGEVVVERVIRGNVSLGSGGEAEGGDGSLDPQAVARGVRGSLSAIRSCYERALRNNPTLSGRLEVRFTIGPAGRVTAANTDGLASAPEVGTCIAGTVRRIVFPAPNGGAVETSFSFNFSPGG